MNSLVLGVMSRLCARIIGKAICPQKPRCRRSFSNAGRYRLPWRSFRSNIVYAVCPGDARPRAAPATPRGVDLTDTPRGRAAGGTNTGAIPGERVSDHPHLIGGCRPRDVVLPPIALHG